jgi:chemotaxis protein histidine kinase CheA
VRTVAEKHHGYVTVKSEIDVMTTFKLQLPAVDYLVGNG